MENRTIGSLTVSLVGLGCNNFGRRIDEAATRAVVEAALDEGITLFDTADTYGEGQSEEYLGRALGSRRDDVIIATKFGMGDGTKLPKGASAASVAEAAEGSLRRLGTDRIDLYQLHAPDDGTPIHETLEALDRLVRDGKVLEIGCSNFDGARIDEASSTATKAGTAPFVSAQNELSVLRRRGERDLLDACERHDLAVLPYFPLASGMLTGKYRRGRGAAARHTVGRDAGRRSGTGPFRSPVRRRRPVGRVRERDNDHTLLELAMSWLAGLPHLASVIAGATKPEQVRANAAAVAWKLTPEQRAEIDKISPAR